MSYCRFENTLTDLKDCYDNMDAPVSASEFSKRKQLIELCLSIVDDYKYLIDEEDYEDEFF